MKSAIITGASGFIGTHLCTELQKNNIEVTALIRSGKNGADRLPADIKILNCSMDEYDSLVAEKADIFYHLAWEGATGLGRDDEVLQTRNVLRTIEALKAAERIGCKRFIALGTVYEKLVPQILSSPQHRKADFYLLSKQSAHYMCSKLAAKLNMEFVWVTIFQPIGRYIKKDQMMAYAIEGLIKGRPPEFGPSMEPYDITAVEDIALGLRLLGNAILSRTEYYIGSGHPMIMRDYLQRAKDILKVDTELKIGERADDGLRFDFDWYDISPIEMDTGYAAKIGFDKAVKNVADWIKEGERK